MKKFLAFLGAFVLLGSIGYLVLPPGPPLLFDANLNRLAQSSAEGYCSGFSYFTASLEEGAEVASECRSTTTLSFDRDLEITTMAFCLGARAGGYDGSLTVGCEDMLKGLRYWPTYDGLLTKAWNRTNPYPLNLLISGVETEEDDNSRTGNRDDVTNR